MRLPGRSAHDLRSGAPVPRGVRAGAPPTGVLDEFISDVLSQLPDPIDLEHDQEILTRYGLSPERLMVRMGGSP